MIAQQKCIQTFAEILQTLESDLELKWIFEWRWIVQHNDVANVNLGHFHEPQCSVHCFFLSRMYQVNIDDSKTHFPLITGLPNTLNSSHMAFKEIWREMSKQPWKKNSDWLQISQSYHSDNKKATLTT